MNGRESSPRLPRNRRASLRQLPEMRLTDRDRQIVLLTYDYRAVTADIVEMVLFPPKQGHDAPVSSRCLHRLKLLFHHGFLARHAQPLVMGRRGVFVYTLDERGGSLLAEMLDMPPAELDWKPQDNQLVRGPFVDHMLLTNTVRAALEVGAQRRDYSVANWRDDIAMRRAPFAVSVQGTRGSERVELVPDAFFYLVRNNQALAYCLELDRGTETVRSNTGAKDFAGKVRAYLAFAKSRPLRVLTVVVGGEQRLRNLKETAAALGDRSVFHFAPYAVAADPGLAVSDEIWHRSGTHSRVALLP